MLDDIIRQCRLWWLRLFIPQSQEFSIKLYFKNPEVAASFQQGMLALIDTVLQRSCSKSRYKKINKHLTLISAQKSGRTLIVYGELTFDDYGHSEQFVGGLTAELFYNVYNYTGKGFPVAGIYTKYKAEWAKVILRTPFSVGRVGDD